MATYTPASATATLVGVAQTKVYLGTTTTTASNDAFVEIGGVMEIPLFGGSDTEVRTQLVGQDLEVLQKGVTTLGGGVLKCAKDETDTGQGNMITAQLDKTGANYNIRIIQPNKATSTGTGTMYDIKAQILGAQIETGSANNVAKINFNLGFNSRPTKTAAT